MNHDNDRCVSTEWHYRPDQPELSDYPQQPPESATLPDLPGALGDIGEYQHRLWANQERSLLLVFHGLDTSGKDSLIRTLATRMDPAGFHAWSFRRPHGDEIRHDFLWRVTPLLPARGEVAAFNRSHHEATISERVFPVHTASRYNWSARHAALRHFEAHLTQEGTTILKFWLNLSAEEHRRRLIARIDKPHKQWKFDQSDIETWRRRQELQRYAEETIAATHCVTAPWFIIPGDSKPASRAIIAQLVADQLQALAPDYPAADKQVLRKYRGMLAGH